MTYIQGKILDRSTVPGLDTRPIAGAVVSPSAGGPMWPGVGVTGFLGDPSVSQSLGSALQLATSLATLTSFTVLDESSTLAVGWGCAVPMAWPAGSPSAQGGPSINVVRLGSGARLVVQAEKSLARNLERAPANTPVGWDFRRQRLIAASAGNQLPVRVVDVTFEAFVIVAGWLGGAKWRSGAAAVIVL